MSLTSDQRERIAEVDGAWADEKKSLEQSIETAFEQGTGGDKTRKEGGAIPVTALTQGMQGYTELSTLYNQRRESHWLQALAVLTPSQQNLVEQIRMEAKQ